MFISKLAKRNEVVKLIEITQEIVNNIIEESKEEIIREAGDNIEVSNVSEELLTKFIRDYLSSYLRRKSKDYPNKNEIPKSDIIVRKYEEIFERNNQPPRLVRRAETKLIMLLQNIDKAKKPKNTKTTDAA